MNEEQEKKKNKSIKNKSSKWWIWPIKVFILALFLSFTFSVISEITLSNTNIIISVIVIFVFIAISIIFDMLGVAVTSSTIEPFLAMASRHIKGSKQAISLIKNADKISSICADVIGDVCGILSGAAGASILTKIAIASNGDFLSIIVASSVSAIIAGFTILGKASFKKFAISHSSQLTFKFAKLINIFTKKD